MTTMTDLARSSTTVPTREMDEIRALQVELDAAKKRIQQCNETSTFTVQDRAQ